MNANFLDKIAKTIPINDKILKTLIPRYIFAFGPLMIKKNITLMTTIKKESHPYLFNVVILLYIIFGKWDESLELIRGIFWGTFCWTSQYYFL